jgi:hypothetical protein
MVGEDSPEVLHKRICRKENSPPAFLAEGWGESPLKKGEAAIIEMN